MGKKILVAGAGHGGLTAAALLARAGYDVTVLEKQPREALGYDWPDCFVPAVLREIGLTPPPAEQMRPMGALHYFSPAKTVHIRPPQEKLSKTVFYIERRDLLRHLCALAEENGAQLRFETPVLGPLTQGVRVTGLRTQTEELQADLVIDAAGMDSPVRTQLPAACGVPREIRAEDTIFTFRAIYEEQAGSSGLPPSCSYFYHAGSCGFDWVLHDPAGVDVLVGAIGGISDRIVDTALADFRKDHPDLSARLLRGGQYAKIPLRRALVQFVCDGYAAVGDSASMIEPLSGSGITQSIRAGAMLAETVLAAGEAPLTVARLWDYQTAWFRRFLRRQLSDDASKSFLLEAGERRLNLLFEKRVLTEKELCGGKQSAADLLHKATGFLSSPSLAPLLVNMLRRQRLTETLAKTLPAQFDPVQFAKWRTLYESF
ncbi:MAG: NAD(P)/FAD-dependent oxidoreductase [Clostridia bacterium]|nr:NAD(P)/FAD-dependent oxidoreductase [Clostridia bacterium]